MTRSVRFANTAQMYIVERHEDYGNNSYNVSRREPFTPHQTFDPWDAPSSKMSSKFVHKLWPEFRSTMVAMMMLQPQPMRAVSAVLASRISSRRILCLRWRLAEHDASKRSSQSKQDRRSFCKIWYDWEAIALASYAQTRKVAIRARKLGKLQQDFVEAEHTCRQFWKGYVKAHVCFWIITI